MSFVIEPGKLYKTRTGDKVRIYAWNGSDSDSPWYWHGAVCWQRGPNGADETLWAAWFGDKAGRYARTENPWDIVSEWPV